MLQKLILLPDSSIKTHILVILIFFAMTCIMTFPVIVNFDTEFAGIGDLPQGRDIPHSLWKIWWYDYSIKNNLDSSHTNFIFYPGGVDVLPHNSFSVYLGLALKQLFNYVQTWNILFFMGYVLGGYSCFLLSNHFKKNFLASIIAGVIFSFGTFHMSHSTVHIGLSTIFWIPLTILFLFRISKNPTKINGIITGILLFFTFFTHMYYGLTMIIFAIVFFVIYLLKSDKLIRKKFVFNYGIAISIFIILILPIILPIMSSLDTNDSFKRDIDEHIRYSLSVQNLFIAAPEQTFSDFNHNIVLGISSFFDFPLSKSLQVEQVIFLGFSSIILSFIAIFKFRNSYVPFWVLIICIFTILSFGPELKIFEDSTEISMPSKILNEIPGWDFFRAEARFVVMASLGMAILSSFAISGINEKFFKTKNKFLIFGGTILFLIMIEFAAIPFSTAELNVPSIYYEIKNDPRQVTVLNAPLGGAGDLWLYTDPIYQYYQTVHEKPIIGGFESRPPLFELRNLQSYFLNQFVWNGIIDDIVKQDLTKVGISIFEYYNIGYVVIHKDSTFYYYQEDVKELLPQLRERLNEIFNAKPDFEDKSLYMYKVPQNNSLESFLILDSGWSILGKSSVGLFREISPTSTINIINPSDSTIYRNLEMNLRSLSNIHTISILNNNEMQQEDIEIPLEPTNLAISNLEINPGINVITIKSDGFSMEVPYSTYENERKVSFRVYSVSMS